MSKIVNTVVRTKGFVRRHKTALTITATSIFWISVQQHAKNEHDEFLKEHNLYEEFYTPTDEEMGE